VKVAVLQKVFVALFLLFSAFFFFSFFFFFLFPKISRTKDSMLAKFQFRVISSAISDRCYIVFPFPTPRG